MRRRRHGSAKGCSRRDAGRLGGTEGGTLTGPRAEGPPPSPIRGERTRGPNGEPPRKIFKGPKGGRARRVAISDGIVEVLGRWYERSVVEGGADASGYVWPGAAGGPMGADSPGQTLERVLRRAGLVDATARPLVSFHGLRHTAASVMLARGVPLLVVSRQLGHRNPNITAEVYAHLLHDAQLDEAMSAFDPRPETVRETVRELPERPRSRFGSGFSARRRTPSQSDPRSASRGPEAVTIGVTS